MRFVAGRDAVAELLAGSAMAKRMAALLQRAIGKKLLAGRAIGKKLLTGSTAVAKMLLAGTPDARYLIQQSCHVQKAFLQRSNC